MRGKRLGPYRLLEHLADGGMAEIFLARREGEEKGTAPFTKELVLKVLQERFIDNADVVAMFLEEARLSAGLRHPNIVDVYEVGEDAGVRFIAMEYIDGRTLTDVVTRSFEVGEPLPLAHAVHIVAEIAAALAYLEAGVPGRGRAPALVHRDVSPTNIVIGWPGQTKLIDFGIARPIVGGKDEAGTRPGKVSYMSPEQVRGQPLDARSDQFSLGTILYEITLGKRLWRGPAEVVMRRIVEEAIVPPTYVQRDYPPGLERIVLRALEKRPQDRFASAADMLVELDRFLGAEVSTRPGPRALGEFLRALYAPGARVSEGGARRAQIFQDDDGAVADPDLAPLDFDKAARPGSGAALAHALRGAEPFELAAEVTAVSAQLAAQLGGNAGGSNGGQFGPGGRTPPPSSARTPPPISLRNAAGVAAGPGPTATASGLSGAGGALTARGAASAALMPAPRWRARAAIVGLLLTILLGGIFFALRGP